VGTYSEECIQNKPTPPYTYGLGKTQKKLKRRLVLEKYDSLLCADRPLLRWGRFRGRDQRLLDPPGVQKAATLADNSTPSGESLRGCPEQAGVGWSRTGHGSVAAISVVMGCGDGL
jgi:hypothetical protein